MSSERLKMIDLFSGAGGLSEGLSEAGFHSLFASEIVPVYAQTYQKNHPNTTVFSADIRELNANEIRKSLGIERGGNRGTLIIGTFVAIIGVFTFVGLFLLFNLILLS